VGELNVGAGNSLTTSNNTRMVTFRDRLFFWADDGTGMAIWSFDGDTYAKPRISDDLTQHGLVPRPPFGTESFAVVDNKLYFSARKDSGSEQELYVFGGTEITLAYDFFGPSNGGVRGLTAVGNKLYLVATDVPQGATDIQNGALWAFDGTTPTFIGATAPVIPASNPGEPGTASSNMNQLTLLDDKIYFVATGPDLTSARPWVFDPASLWSQTLSASSNPADLSPLNTGNPNALDFGLQAGKIYFGSFGNADDGTTSVGRELWVYDPSLPVQTAPAPAGSQRNPALVEDFRPGSTNSEPQNFINAQGWLYFRIDQVSSPSTRLVYAIDENGAVQKPAGLTNFLTNLASGIFHLRAFQDRLIFGNQFASPVTMRSYDRNADQLATLFTSTGTAGSNFNGLSVFQNRLYWAETTVAEGRELYRLAPPAPPATIDLNPLIFAAAPSEPAVYGGPVLERFSPNPAQVGETLEITGLRLDQISRLEIDGTELEILEAAATLLTAKLPLTLTLGVKNVVAHSSAGKLTVQDAIELTAAARSNQPRFYTKKNLGSASLNFYARDIVGAGKVRFVLNGREVAWVRATDATNPKLNVGSAAARDGLVRTVGVGSRWSLVAGRNVLEIYVGENRLVRRIFTQ
jgi:hypothetical protein